MKWAFIAVELPDELHGELEQKLNGHDDFDVDVTLDGRVPPENCLQITYLGLAGLVADLLEIRLPEDEEDWSFNFMEHPPETDYPLTVEMISISKTFV